MAKTSTNINLDVDLKKACQELFSDLGMDLTTAVTIFLKQSLRVQGLPFPVTRDIPHADPFYSTSNMNYLRQVVSEIDSGKARLTEHDLIED